MAKLSLKTTMGQPPMFLQLSVLFRDLSFQYVSKLSNLDSESKKKTYFLKHINECD